MLIIAGAALLASSVIGIFAPWAPAGSPVLAQSAPATNASSPAPAGAPPTAEVRPRPRLGGYLADHLPDHRAFLSPPPAVGSVLGLADVAIFAQTRKLEGTSRWQLATSDNEITRQAMLADFGCALGVDLASADAPALARVLTRSGADLFPVIGAAKDFYDRPRPFLSEEGAICVTPSEEFARSGSYPSGHAASGWLYALLLAEIAPEHADALIARGRAFGESRVVCGVHWLSDIEGGRLTAAALVAALHGAPQFETDVAAARAELTTLRTSGGVKPPASCDAEGASLKTPW
jgi:acid phosphatase (class A)